MIVRFALLCLLVLPFGTLAADERPRLVAAVTVAADVVTLGDLVRGAGAVSRTAVFRAPEPGTHGTIQAIRVLEAAHAYGLADIDTAGVAEVRVAREARHASELEVRAIVADELSRRHGALDRARLTLAFDGPIAHDLDVAPDATLSLDRFAFDPVSGRFEARLVGQDASGRRSRPQRLAGVATEHVEVLRLRRAVSRNEVITASDMILERQPRNRGTNDIAVAVADVVGLAARRTLAEGTVLRMADLERPRVVARNETVTIVFETAALLVTARGRTLEGGAVGDVIDVQNITSRRTIQATIAGPGKVIVRAGMPRRIAATTPSPSQSRN